ncbi:MAG: lipopolysaccharide biosynthesis protein [Bacteroidaceae bacterium]|nr:lipopolysaccharide biosynthesis protein [Bacteroidaceae bacterium]
MPDTLKEKTARGLLWGAFNNGAQQLLNAIFGIVLAWHLTKADFGLVGMIMVFSAVAGIFQEGGFISALNKRKNITPDDYNSVFWFNVVVAATIYAVLFFAAPYIAQAYREPLVTPLARYVFLGFLISSFNTTPRAYLFRNLMVKQTAIISFTALLISGIVGIAMAIGGCSYWSLATQNVVYAVVVTILSYHYSKFRPRLRFSFRPIREMFGFSSKLILTNLFNALNQYVLNVLFALFYTKVQVGVFSQANKWNLMGSSFVTNMLQGVAQPVFTKMGTEADQLRALRKLMRFTAMLAFPAMLGLSLIAGEFIVWLLGEEWRESAAILSLLCLWGACQPFSSLFGNLIISRGRSDIYMWVTIALFLVQIVAMVATQSFGMAHMLRVFVGVNAVWMFVWHFFVYRQLQYKVVDFLRDLAPYLLLSAALYVAVYFATCNVNVLLLRLIAKVVLFAVAYCLVLWFSGSVIFREGINYLMRRHK